MKHLIDKKKFVAELEKEIPMLGKLSHTVGEVLSRHTKAMVDEPHHPSGMDRDKINTRNELLEELRNG